MSFNPNPGRKEYTAGVSQTVFTFDFKIFVDTDIKVYQTPLNATPDDTNDLLTLTTDYTVSINGDLGGTITLVSASTLGDSITLKRELPITRLTEYQTSGDLLATTLNQDQDYQTYLTGDKQTDIERALKFEDSVQNVNAVIPAPEALKVLGWNSGETALENFTLGDDSVFVNIYNADSIADLLLVDPTIYSTVNVRGYYTQNDGGGGIFNYDATQSAVNNGGTIINGWVRQYSGALNIKWFGAKGDGTTDDTTIIQSVLNIGGDIYIPEGTFNFTNLDLTVTGTTIFGNRSAILKCIVATGSNFALHIKDDDITLIGFSIYGSVTAGTYQNGNRAIYCNEDLTLPLTYVYRLKIEGLEIKNFGDFGMRFDYVQGCSTKFNYIHDCGYCGIMFGAGCFDNTIHDNTINNITPGSGGTSPYLAAYGITISRDPAKLLIDAPISKRNRITNNKISYVQGWVGIDSHGSQDTQIEGNSISYCSIGIHLEDGDSVSEDVPSSRINIIGNKIIGNAGTSFKAGPGINCKGAADSGASPQTDLNITGNHISKSGWETLGIYSLSHGAIHMVDAESSVISGNIITQPYGNGIMVHKIGGLTITGNSIRNVQSSTGDQYGINIADGDVSAIIESNTFYGSGTQTNIHAETISDAGYEYSIGNNFHYGTATTLSPLLVECTIATGEITVSGGWHLVDTQTDNATDDLDTINGGTQGMKVTLQPSSSARTVVVKDGTGNINTAGDFTMDNAADSISLVYNGSSWFEISRSDNGA